eukprot:Gregarina_sp_Pseudo_9__5665@NODE_7_length_7070_cov_43_502062_g5_i0_p1_GENE_NODE_7_length_7070_cov_43_502062_g5_i0NODE_7_length_7070_cov_43_502062_g5_i0_p1_ORF_typecomplete_len619_score216_81Hat1_N/PF10394_9/4_4e07Hat1_N/PF10394_9/2_9e03Acetyltransf_1/PF00583_25/8_2e02Acetyltransf_1/PF00583_25/0_012Acetyltransf_10/PF13673_7/0_0034Acetyltransf_7/PF13508_7/1_6e04Acetyltransf_7/PF13508_7/0_38_NODE_7_length_7070_cov_43_502062_g5_i019023758
MSTLTADRFLLHACLSEDDFNIHAPNAVPASYIHHFFPEAPKHFCHPSLKVHVFYIPVTFDVLVVVEGKALWNPLAAETAEASVEDAKKTQQAEAANEMEAQRRLVEALETEQQFPGGFTKNEEAFRAKLKALSAEQKCCEAPVEPATKKLKRDPSLAPAPTNTAQSLPAFPIRISGRVIARLNHRFPPMGGGQPAAETETAAAPHFWLVEANLPLADNPASAAEVDATHPVESSFAFVHRRVEWFMHFYIDAMSNIHVDPRWRVFVALRYLSPHERLEQVRLETETAREQALAASTGGEAPQLAGLAKSITDKWPAVDVSVKEEFLNALDGYRPQTLPVDAALDAALLENGQPAEVLAVVTVYQFFALPRDRARISQFFVLPHRQRIGLGRSILCALTEVLCADANIRQITVEDPAPAFQRLRDVCSVSMAVRFGILRAECLYPTREIEEASRLHPSKRLQAVPFALSPAHPQRWREYSAALRHILKETPAQRHRVKLLLRFARLIPSQLLNPAQTKLTSVPVPRRAVADDTPSRLGRRKLTPGSEESNELIEWQRLEPTITEIRVKEKRRFRLESIEWYSQKRTLGDIQAELETEWRSLFKSLCASLRVLRCTYSL